MIACAHGHIRTAEPDDAPALRRVYDYRAPRAAVLDNRREPYAPVTDELREMLAQRDTGQNAFFAIEDDTGAVRGFIALRGIKHDAGFAELSLMFIEDDALGTPLAAEALDFAADRPSAGWACARS